MSDILEKTIKKLCIDRSDWELVKFGDVAIQQKKSVDRDTTGITKYVKGEHMYSEDLHLREWGELEDEYLGPAFIRLFDEGDILYGSRRTYLRKVTIAPFEGITSNTTFVMKANEKKIDKRLLPFVMLSEGFAEHSIKNSKGSVNPYVNWKDLASYEFLLPPKEQQAELAELLWAMDEVIEKDSAIASHNSILYQTERETNCLCYNANGDNSLSTHLKTYVGNTVPFKKLGTFLHAVKYGTSQKGNTENKGVKVIGIPNVVNEKLTIKPCNFAELSEKEAAACKLEKGDIVIVRTNGNPDYTGRSALFDSDEEVAYASYLIKITASREVFDPEFLVRYLQTKAVRKFFRRNATSTAGNYNINTEVIKSIPVPILPISNQKEIVQKLKLIEKCNDSIDSKISASKALQKSLINEVF